MPDKLNNSSVDIDGIELGQICASSNDPVLLRIYAQALEHEFHEHTARFHAELGFVEFLEFIEQREDGCWHWLGRIGTGGFPLYKIDSIMWVPAAHLMLAHGDRRSPFDGAMVAHRCANLACVNPDHLVWAKPSTVSMMARLERQRQRAWDLDS